MRVVEDRPFLCCCYLLDLLVALDIKSSTKYKVTDREIDPFIERQEIAALMRSEYDNKTD
jgi:hypothetical protein